MWWALTAGSLALGSDRGSWDLLDDALLVESIDGDLAAAARVYEQLVRNHPIEDPSRGEAFLALGRARWQLDQSDRAREALLEGIRTGACLARCQDLLGRIALEEQSITSVPIRWTFDDANHGVFHPWPLDARGTIRLAQVDGETVLAWRTLIDARDGDQLVVGLRHPDPPPRLLRLRVRSEDTDAWLQVVVVDDLGRAYTSPQGAFWAPVGRWAQLELDLGSVDAVDATASALDPARISRIQIRDVSAIEGAPSGPNTLLVDDVEVR